MAQNSFQESTSQDIEQMITCPICHDHYKDPRLLPCSHTFCLKCIRRAVEINGGQCDCPFRDGTSISGDAADSLPLNRTVRDLVETFGKNQVKINCCNCEQHSATLWCRDCQCKAYCTECHKNVHQLPAFADHRPGETRPPKIIKCEDHPTKEVEFWCSGTGKPCCSLCMLVPDVARECAPIDDVFNKIAEQLKNDFKNHPLSINYDTKLQEMFLLYEKSSTAKTIYIDERFAAMRRMIDEHEKAIKEEKSSIDMRNRKAIEAYQRMLFNEAKTLRQRWVLLDCIIDAKDYIGLLGSQNRFQDELNELIAKFDALNDPVAVEFDIEGLDQCLKTVKRSLEVVRVKENPSYRNEELERRLALERNDGTLNLNNFGVNDHDAAILARYLQKDRKTTTLHLGNNQIKAAGAKYIADSLRYNRTLQQLELWNNQIGDEGVEYLTNALRQNRTLTWLGLNANNISNQGAQNISVLLQENTVLTIVHLNDNLVGDEGFQSLISILKENKTLKQLHILQNPQISEKIRKKSKGHETRLY